MSNDRLSSRDALRLSREDMRELGYRVIDILVDHIDNLPDRRVGHTARRDELEGALREPMPKERSNPLEVLRQVEEHVLPNLIHMDHPRFFGFVSSPGNFVSVMGDTLAAGFNIFAGSWLEASGPTQVELVAVDWLRQACGLPETAGGIFVSGGSAANIAALAVARRVHLDGDMNGAVVYTSDQTHSSIERGLGLLGFDKSQLRTLETDHQFRFDVARLRAAIAEDRAAGARPFCVIATPGSTNTGAVDPLPELASLCRAENMWLHADGAYGAAAAFSSRREDLLAGLGEVDSLTLDPHKWLFQPFEIGCVLFRDEDWLEQTFSLIPAYLEDATSDDDEINMFERGVQLTRAARALKLWMSLKTFGSDALADAIDRGFELAESAAAHISEMPEWELVSPPQMGIVAFRCVPGGMSESDINRLNQSLVAASLEDGFAMVTSTVLRGTTALRMCCINPRTTGEDIKATLERLDELRR